MRFYAAVLVLLLAALLFATQRYRRFHEPDVNVAVVELVGPTHVRPGVHTRYAAVVHDRAGAPLADVKVRVGFEHNGFDEVTSAVTGVAGDATFEVAVPPDLAEPRLLRVHAEGALGHAEDDHWIAPRAPRAPRFAVSTDRARYDAGDTVRVRAAIEHFGAPPAEETVTVSLERGGVRYFQEAAKTSPFGVAALDIPLAVELPMGSYEVFVRTSEGQSIVGSAGVDIGPPPSPSLRAPPVSDVLRATVHPEGGALVAGAVQNVYVAVKGGHREARVVRVPSAPPAPVSPDGVAKVTLTVPTSSFELEVTDDAGHRVVEALRPAAGALALHTDHESFAGGAPMHVTVFGAAAGEHVLLQLSRGEDTLAWRSGSVARAEEGCAFDVPLPKDLQGIVWLQAATPDGTRLGRRLVTVTSPSRSLLVTVSADSNAANIDVVDAETMAPVKAELGLASVGPDAAAFERTARDLATALSGGFDAEDVHALLDAAPDDELRGVTLARLSAAGRAPAPITDRDVYADDSERRERLRWRGWVTLGLGFIALALLAPFLVHGLDLVTLGRRPHEALPRDERDRRWARLLWASTAWATALFVPPVAAILHDLVAKATFSRDPSPLAIATTWGISAGLTALVVMLASARARAFVSPHALASALAFGHAACVLELLDDGRAVGALLVIARDRHGLPLVLLATGQLVFAVLAVVRITTTEPTTLRDRRTRFLKSAGLCGLPLTLGVLGWGAYLHVVAANESWSELAARSPEASAAASAPSGDDLRVRPVVGHVSTGDARSKLWLPRIATDEHGHAHVPLANVDETLRLEVKAVGRTGRTGAATTTVVVERPLRVEANVPGDLTVGDALECPVTVAAQAATDVTLTMEGLASATRRFEVAAGATHVEQVRVTAVSAGRHLLKLEVVGGGHRELLEKNVTVRPRATRAVRVVNGGEATMEFAGDGELGVTVYGSPVAALRETMESTDAEPHGSLARAIGAAWPSLLLLDHLTKAKTPKPDHEARARRNLQLGLQRILAREGENGGFGSNEAQATMTLRELARFIDVDPGVLRRAKASLSQPRTDSWARQAESAWALAGEPGDSPRLALLQQKRPPATDDREPNELAFLANALVASGRDARPWLDALAQEVDGPGLRSLEALALSAYAFGRANVHGEVRARLIARLATERDERGLWPSATSQVLRALYSDIDPSPPGDVAILVDGAEVETHHFDPKKLEEPWRVDLSRHATPGTHTIEVRGSNVSSRIVAQREEAKAPRADKQREGSDARALTISYPTLPVAVGSVAIAKLRFWHGNEPVLRQPVIEIPIPPGMTLDPGSIHAAAGATPVATERLGGRLYLHFAALGPEGFTELELPFRAECAGRVTAPPVRAFEHHERVAESRPSVLTIE